MNGLLTFKLPEEKEDFEMAQKGWDYRHVLSDILEDLRNKYKYQDKTTVDIQEFREFIYDLIKDRNLEI